MNEVILEGIATIIKNRTDLLRIAIRQKAKFEGWLKFELAHYLEQVGMDGVAVETKNELRRDRSDITFCYNYYQYTIELKTSNTNWFVEGIKPSGRPITKNIDSIIDDSFKLNSQYGIVAFVLFPIPSNDSRWERYVERIAHQTGIDICVVNNCKLIEVDVAPKCKCNVLVCSFLSKYIDPFSRDKKYARRRIPWN